MKVILDMDAPKKGATFVKEVDGQFVIFQIVEVQNNSQKSYKQFSKEELEILQNKLKGSVIKDDDDPFGPAIPEGDWEVYKS